MPIRYDKQLNRQLLRTVQNYNQKITRMEREGVAVPAEKVRVRDIKREFTDRRELLSYMRELRKLSKRGVENIVYIDRYGKEYSEYEFKIGGFRQRRALRIGARLLEKARKTHRTEGGEAEAQTLMGTDYVSNIEANIERLKKARYSKKLSKEQRAAIVRASVKIIGTKKYQFTLKANFGKELYALCEVANITQDVPDTIMELLDKLDGKQFEMLRSAEELVVKIEEYYPRLKDAKTPADRIRVGREVRPFIMALYETLPRIIEEITGETYGQDYQSTGPVTED